MTDDPLWQALQAAHNQATDGKGKERHGGDTPFAGQPIMAIQRMLEGSPVDGHLFQVMKKAQEAGRMARRGDGDAATRELYGVIVYAAAAVMRLKESQRLRAPQMRTDGLDLNELKPGAVQYLDGKSLTATEVEKRAEEARTAIDRALEELGCQEHEVDPSVVRDMMRRQREAAIDPAGQKLRAGEFKPEDDNG